MATFRVGVGSFNINDGAVGIGTEGSGHGNLRVEGVIKSTKNLDVLGVSTFTRYSGFSADEVNINNRDITLSGEYSTTGDIVVEDGASLTVGLGSTACVGSVECISVKHHFSVPVGDTAQRNETSGYAEGTVRYNRDLGTMEFFNGDEWRQFNYQSDVQNSPSNRGRALNMGGQIRNSPYHIREITYINVQSKGNAVNFGDGTGDYSDTAALANEIRGINTMGNSSPGLKNDIQYVTMASEGDAIDFGDLTQARMRGSALSSSTRGVVMGGRNPGSTNVMDYIEIMTLGNALDFGDLGTSGTNGSGSVSSPTRGIIANVQIDYIITASKGNSTEFGKDLFVGQYHQGGGSTGARGMWAGGYSGPYAIPYTAVVKATSIRGINIESGGLAVEFGNMVSNRGSTGAAYNYHTGTSDKTRAVWMGGYQIDPNQHVNNIDYFTMNSSGSAQDFGDLTKEHAHNSSCCDSHGGLGGF